MEIFNYYSWGKLSKYNFFMQTVDAGASKYSLDQLCEQADLPDLAGTFSGPSSRVLEKPRCISNQATKQNDQFAWDTYSIC